jgi:integrase
MRGTVRRRSDSGSWAVFYDAPRGEDGRRRKVSRSGFKTEREAQKWLNAELARIDRGEYVERSHDTLGAYLTRWLDSKKPDVKTTTWTGYEVMVTKHLIPRLGHVRLQDLKPLQIDSVYSAMLKDGHRQREGRGLSPRTVRQAHIILRQALADAEKKGLVVRNVADAASPPKARASELASRKMRNWWTAEQVGQFMAAVKGDRLEAAWVTLAQTGLRRGELLGLRWQDVDLDVGKLRVEQALVAPRYQMQMSDPKSENGKRVIGIGPVTVAALRAHRERQQLEASWFGEGWGRSPAGGRSVVH